MLLYYWLYYCRPLYYVFFALTLIVMWTFICICILHYCYLWNDVKISLWTCYYILSVISSVLFGKYRNQTDFTDTEFSRYRVFFRNRSVPISEEQNLQWYRRTEPIGSVFTECPGLPSPTFLPPPLPLFLMHPWSSRYFQSCPCILPPIIDPLLRCMPRTLSLLYRIRMTSTRLLVFMLEWLALFGWFLC